MGQLPILYAINAQQRGHPLVGPGRRIAQSAARRSVRRRLHRCSAIPESDATTATEWLFALGTPAERPPLVPELSPVFAVNLGRAIGMTEAALSDVYYATLQP